MGHPKAKIAKMDDDNDIGSVRCDNTKLNLDTSEKTSMNNEKKLDQGIEEGSDITDKLLDLNPGSPCLPPISKKDVDDGFDESVIPKLLGLYFLLLITFTNCFLE